VHGVYSQYKNTLGHFYLYFHLHLTATYSHAFASRRLESLADLKLETNGGGVTCRNLTAREKR
jgi:hypothetical protein